MYFMRKLLNMCNVYLLVCCSSYREIDESVTRELDMIRYRVAILSICIVAGNSTSALRTVNKMNSFTIIKH